VQLVQQLLQLRLASLSLVKPQKKLQTAYEKVRSAYKGKVPAKQLKMLEQIARNCQADFQLKFQAEIQKYIVKVKAGRRGTILKLPQDARFSENCLDFRQDTDLRI
jgi:hypothetical protein